MVGYVPPFSCGCPGVQLRRHTPLSVGSLHTDNHEILGRVRLDTLPSPFGAVVNVFSLFFVTLSRRVFCRRVTVAVTSFTMLDSARLSHLAKFALPLFVFFCALIYLTGGQSSYSQFIRQFKDEKKLFVADFLEHEIDGRFDGAPIQRLCSTRKWTPGLIMSCEPHPGGVGEVKNAHLHCIRIAMELGGWSDPNPVPFRVWLTRASRVDSTPNSQAKRPRHHQADDGRNRTHAGDSTRLLF